MAFDIHGPIKHYESAQDQSITSPGDLLSSAIAGPAGAPWTPTSWPWMIDVAFQLHGIIKHYEDAQE
ncbi:hypothetical protein VTO73DRAFT_12148 [Trametes versicolor]